MSITTTCPGCKSLFRLPEELAGKKVRCQKCANMFLVPGPHAEAPAPSAPAEAPVESDRPRPEVVLAPMSLEPPKDEVEQPTVAETTAPASSAEHKPTPSTLRRPPAPERPASVLASLALMLLFLATVIGLGAFALTWTVRHLGPPIRNTSVPIHSRDGGNQLIGFDKKDGGIVVIDKLPDDRAQQIFVGFDQRALVQGQTVFNQFPNHGKWNQAGPYWLYQMHFKEGFTYNLCVMNSQSQPRLRIFDGGAEVADLTGAAAPDNRLILAFQPKRTGAYFLWVNTQNVTNFSLFIAPVTVVNPVQVNLNFQPSYIDNNGLLRIDDPLDATGSRFGPYRDYDVTLVGGREYVIRVENANFLPVLRINDDKPLTIQGLPGANRLSHEFRPPNKGTYRIRVSSEKYSLGVYQLRIEPKPVAIQRILATFDERGSYESKREFTTGDPTLAGRGSYKEYLISLEEGKKYRFEMSLGESPTALTLLDPNNNETASVPPKKDAALLHTATQSGTYRLHIFAALPKQRAEYTVRITTEP